MTSNAENSKKYPSKLSNEVHKKISGEDICGLCNAKINFSKNIRKNCEKTNFLEEYTLNDKYDIKFKNNYNEERKLSPSCYILCDVCREQHPLSKTSKSSSLTLSSPLKDENTQGKYAQLTLNFTTPSYHNIFTFFLLKCLLKHI